MGVGGDGNKIEIGFKLKPISKAFGRTVRSWLVPSQCCCRGPCTGPKEGSDCYGDGRRHIDYKGWAHRKKMRGWRETTKLFLFNVNVMKGKYSLEMTFLLDDTPTLNCNACFRKEKEAMCSYFVSSSSIRLGSVSSLHHLITLRNVRWITTFV